MAGLAAAGRTVPGDILVDIGAASGGPAAATDQEGRGAAAAALLEARSVAVLVSADLLRSPEARATLQQLANLLQVLRALGKSPAMQFLFDRANQMGALEVDGLANIEDLRALCLES